MRRFGIFALYAVLAWTPLLSAQGGKTEPKAGEEREFEIFKGVQMKFCWVPAGKSKLGEPESKEEKEYETKKGFWLGKYEVTQGEWKKVMDAEPSKFKGAQLPVESVSWDDCQEFLKKCKVAGLKLKLPHEDEWEYAYRGGLGNKQAFYWGDSLNGDKANCDGNYPYGTATKGDYEAKTTEVGKYEKQAPHPWGLCDMSGNVLEWCDNLRSSGDSGRVYRGGSWYYYAWFCRSAFRYWNDAALSINILGCRLALAPPKGGN